MIDISGADKVEVLLQLFNHGYNNSMLREQLSKKGPQVVADAIDLQHELPTMTREQAQRLVAAGDLEFDWLLGRKFAVNLAGDTFDEWLYDRDSSPGQARRALENVKGVRFL